MNEEQEIQAFIAENGVKKLPRKSAAVLGESTPGWRRNAERRAELAEKRGRKVAPRKQQSALRQRYGQ